MRPIRVLVVDDAVVIRRLLSDTLAGDPGIEVVGAAASGRIALQKIPQVTPDVVTLDVEMPEMSGLETLAAIRASYPKLPVIMFSTLTARGAGATLEALALGAADYVTKPANVGSVQAAMQAVREQLIPKIKTFCGAVAGHERPAPRPPAPAPRPLGGRPVELLAIGVSTGGPNALSALLPSLPGAFPVPIVVVQHMPPVFTRLLAERLQARCALRVREAQQGEALRAGEVLVAPGDWHLTVARTGDVLRARLHQEQPENSCRPAVDVLFRGAAAAAGPGVLGLVLTGMGHDGLRGARDIRDAGGQIVVQDQATSVVWGMPGAVAEAGLADRILPLEEIATDLMRRVARGRSLPPRPGTVPGAETGPGAGRA